MQGIMLLSEATVCQIKKLSARYGILPCEFLNRGVLDTSKTLDVITTALGFLPEFDDKTLLLKASHTLITGHKESKVVETGSSPLLASSHSTEGAMHAAG